MPTKTNTANKSSKNPTTGSRPIKGTANSGSTNAPNASTIVKPRTIKPQKAKTCAIPGIVQAKSFFCPSTSVTSAFTRVLRSAVRPTAG